MSSTGRGGKRKALDAYYTPNDLAVFLVGLLRRHVGKPRGDPDLAHLTALEPHAGGGAFVRALAADGWAVETWDIDPNAPGLIARRERAKVQVGDALKLIPMRPPIVICGNPPYSSAEAHVRRALTLATPQRGVVGFLLRLGFLASRKRSPFWGAHPATCVYVLSERPSFTGGGTDSCDYGFFVWDTGLPTAAPRLEVVSWKS